MERTADTHKLSPKFMGSRKPVRLSSFPLRICVRQGETVHFRPRYVTHGSAKGCFRREELGLQDVTILE